MDSREIGRIFYRDGYRLANQYLGGGVTVDKLREAIRAVYEVVDGLLEAFIRRTATDGKPVQCRNGCYFCCHQPVFAVSHEMLYLKDYIGQWLPAETQSNYIDRSRDKSLLTLHKPLKVQQQISFPCPFLENHSCSVYPARPMACRIYLSSSVDSCKREYEEPGTGGHKPELYEFPLNAGRMLNEGFVSCLKQMGLQSVELPLEQGYASLVTLKQDFRSWIG
ncbi:MAG: YkgJ family cysteine cluster protein [Bacteroidales bacterium]